MFYIFLLIVVIAVYILIDYCHKLGKINNKKKCFLIITGIILTIVIGCRSYDIGIDTEGYKRAFDFYKINSWETILLRLKITDISSLLNAELGYASLNYLLSHVLNFDFRILCIAYAGLFMFVNITYINKFSKHILLSIVLLIMGLFVFSLSSIRQTMAISFCMIAFLYCIEKKPFKYIFFIVIGILFHKSALIFMPIYFLNFIKKDKLSFLILIFFCIIIMLFRENIIYILNDTARISYEINQGLGNITLLFKLSMTIFCIYIYMTVPKTEEEMLFFKVMILILFVYTICNFNPTTFRLVYYYTCYEIIIIPYIIDKFKYKSTRIFLLTFILIYYGSVFCSSIFSYANKLLPYSFF